MKFFFFFSSSVLALFLNTDKTTTNVAPDDFLLHSAQKGVVLQNNYLFMFMDYLSVKSALNLQLDFTATAANWPRNHFKLIETL